MLSKVAAVVLTWRDVEMTVGCVHGLVDECHVPEVFLVDNESTGRLREPTRNWNNRGLRLVELVENRGFAAGLNQGLRKVLENPEVDYVLVINNDATISPKAYRTLISALDEDPALGMVAPVILDSMRRINSTGGKLNWMTWAIDETSNSPDLNFLTWACVLIRTSVLREVGLLDERFFMYWEDVDYGIRLQNAGVKFTVIKGAEVIHNVSASHGQAGSRISAYAAAGLAHLSSKQGSFRRFTASFRLFAKVIKRLVRADFRGARYVVAGWLVGRRATDPVYESFELMR